MHKIRQTTVSLGVVLLSMCGFAQEIKTTEENEAKQVEEWPLLQAGAEENKKYRGVATFDNNGFMCTAFVVKPSGCTSKDQKAVLMTNGHCTQSLNANAVGGERVASYKIKFGDFAGAKESEVVNASTTRVIYESMKKQDIAVLELNMTYGELEAKGIPSYRLAASHLPEDITTIGRPFEKTPDGVIHHRKAQCQLEKQVGVIEGDWYWPQALATNCPSQRGASGSPMFNSKGEVVGILNTGSSNPGPGSPRCPANSPCEIDKDGKHNYVPHKTYGFETGPLNSCFQQCKWSMEVSACRVAKESAPDFKIRKTSMQTLQMNAAVPKPYTHARYKLVPVGNGDCTAVSDYKDIPVTMGSIFYENKLKPYESEGKYHLCILGGTQQADGSVQWDSTSKAYSKNVTIDRTPPQVDVHINKTTLTINYKNPVDMGDAGFGYKKVKSVADCNNPKNYVAHKGPPLRVPEAGVILCLKAQDSAGNWQTTPTTVDSKGMVN